MSYIAHSKNDYEQSLALCESAKNIYESITPPTSNEVIAHVYTGMGYSLNEMQRNEEAIQAGRRAIELLEEISSPELIRAYRDEGRFSFDAKKYEESLVWYKKALNFVTPDEKEFNNAWDLFNIARCLIKLKKFHEAVETLKSARALFKVEKSLLHITFCDEELTLAYLGLNELENAKAHGRLALDFAMTAEDEVRNYWASVRFAQVCEANGEYSIAYDYFKSAKSWEVGNSKYTHWPHVFQLELEIANCLEGLNKTEEAQEIRRRVGAMSDSLGISPEMP